VWWDAVLCSVVFILLAMSTPHTHKHTHSHTDLEKLNKIRAILAKKNQEIAAINRDIDEVCMRGYV
jgi:hypothetical protein